MGREATIRLEALERLVRGQSCFEELLPVLSRMANGSAELGVEALVNMAGRPCLTARGNADVRASVAAAVNGILASPATVEGVPVPRERIPRIAGLLAGVAAAKRDDLLERSRRETESSPPGPPAGTTAADSPVGPAARSGVEVAAFGGTGAGVKPARAPKPDPRPAGPPPVRQPNRARSSLAPAAPRDPTWLAMDVWQSAWGDFSGFDALVRYLNTNHISEAFLNPGIGTSEIWQDGGSRRVEKLVRQLRDGGVPRIGFLYAELNYPIREFARFLKGHPDLGIDLLVDDSEFTDSHRERFRTNAAQVQAEGIRYAAFVSVEKVGNSGVSRATREWAIEHLDEVFLMSYFSCDLAGQQELLEALLKHADEVGERTGRRQFVRIAVLMGKKSTGKEVSCEKALRKELFPAFLVDLHRWALATHPSYGGIVLETNEKFPSFDVAPNAWAPR